MNFFVKLHIDAPNTLPYSCNCYCNNVIFCVYHDMKKILLITDDQLMLPEWKL